MESRRAIHGSVKVDNGVHLTFQTESALASTSRRKVELTGGSCWSNSFGLNVPVGLAMCMPQKTSTPKME